MSLYQERAAEMLQIHGLRRTRGRIALLTELATATNPVPIDVLRNSLGQVLDGANLYRSLEAFEERGIVSRSEFRTGKTYYELTHDKPHHHHIICERCDLVTDIPAKDTPQMTADALKLAPGFSRITNHSLEFYGLCVSCA